MLRAPDDGREHGARGVVPGEAGLAHAGPVVDDERLDFFFGHDELEVKVEVEVVVEERGVEGVWLRSLWLRDSARLDSPGVP